MGVWRMSDSVGTPRTSLKTSHTLGQIRLSFNSALFFECLFANAV